MSTDTFYDLDPIFDDPFAWSAEDLSSHGISNDNANHDAPGDARAELLRDAARQYHQAGITPLNARPVEGAPAKFPSYKKWTTEPTDIDTVLANIAGEVDGVAENLDIVCGKQSGGLVVVDIDSQEAAAVWPHVLKAFGLDTPLRSGRPSVALHGHWYYRVEGDTASARFAHPGPSGDRQKGTHIDLLGDGHCAMAPPSIHPDTGEQVEWRNGFVAPPVVDATLLKRAVRLTATGATLGRIWSKLKGKRDEVIFAFSGALALAGFTLKEAQAAVKGICAAGKDEEVSQRLATVKRTYKRFQAGESVANVGALREALPAEIHGAVVKWLEISSAAETPEAKEEQDADVWTPLNIFDCIDREPEPMKWLFQDTIPEGIVAGISAAGGTGKSYMTLQLAISAATGKVVLPTFNPVEAVPVMYFPGEDPVEVTRRRLWNVVQKYPLTDDERELLEKNLLIYPHKSELLVRVMPDGSTRPTNRFAWMKKQVRQFQPKLIILDPKARWFDGDENSNDKVTRDVTFLEELIRPTNATLIITHHVNKTGKSSMDISSVRGASGFSDATRLFFGMVKESGAGQVEVQMNVTKSNYTATWPTPIRLRPLVEFEGVLEEVVEQADEEIVEEMVGELAGLLKTHGPQNVSKLTQSRKGEDAVYQAMVKKFPEWKKVAKQVIEFGLNNRQLVETQVKTGGRAATCIAAADNENWN